jgi:hypothetical protein
MLTEPWGSPEPQLRNAVLVVLAHDQEVMGSNTGTVYWMDVSNASYYINAHENNKNKGSQMGHTKKIFLKNVTFVKRAWSNCA